jgi:hypothetical protein
MVRLRTFAAIAVGAASLVGMTAAYAAPPSNSSVQPYIGLASVSGGASAQPQLGSTVNFVTRYSSTYKNPRVVIQCYQGNVVVWSYVGLTTDSYKLGGDSSPWLDNGGSATCVADLDNLTWDHKVESFTQLANDVFTAS